MSRVQGGCEGEALRARQRSVGGALIGSRSVLPLALGLLAAVAGGVLARRQTARAVERATEPLRSSGERSRRLLENSNDLIAVVNEGGDLLSANPAAERLLGLAPPLTGASTSSTGSIPMTVTGRRRRSRRTCMSETARCSAGSGPSPASGGVRGRGDQLARGPGRQRHRSERPRRHRAEQPHSGPAHSGRGQRGPCPRFGRGLTACRHLPRHRRSRRLSPGLGRLRRKGRRLDGAPRRLRWAHRIPGGCPRHLGRRRARSGADRHCHTHRCRAGVI